MNNPELRLDQVYIAHKKIQPLVRKTALEESPRLSRILGTNIFLKLENQQVTGSFKIRGATNKIFSLNADERSCGVIAISSGNHGRAVSYVAQKTKVRAVICISETVPDYKVQAIRDHGAEIVVAGKTYDEAEELAIQLKNARGLTMVHPFDDPYIITGQATIGLEMMEDLPEIETIIAPLSGGGLLGGIAFALKSIKPSVHIVGVSMEHGPAMIESLKAGRIVEIIEEPSLADALIGGLGDDNRYTFNLIQKYVDETVLVSEEEIATAMTFALEKHHLVIEGSGAVGIAALLHRKVSRLGKNVVVVLSGSNVDLPTLLQVTRGRFPYQDT